MVPNRPQSWILERKSWGVRYSAMWGEARNGGSAEAALLVEAR